MISTNTTTITTSNPIEAASRINEELYKAGKLSFQMYASNIAQYKALSDRQTTTTTTTATTATTTATSAAVYVGQYRPHSQRTGALSELEYYEYTGQKLGEDYRQTKSELLSAIGVKESDIKLSGKEEEEGLVAHYLKARYPWSSEKERESSIKEVSLIVEKGMLRKQFEANNLGISEQTLQEYIDIKRSSSRPELTFAQYAYEKTIGSSKTDIEKFGLGLFTQQALGFYQLGKDLGKHLNVNIKNEYLDLLTIAQSYNPAVENEVVSSIAPFKKIDAGNLGYNLGVGLGLAIDIATLKGVVSSAVKYIKTPKTFVAFGSELRTGKMPSFRDITVHATKIGKTEYVKQSVNPLNIPSTIKATIKDIKATIKGEKLEREIKSKLVTATKAHITESLEQAPVKPTQQKVEVTQKPLLRVDTEKGLAKTNILLDPLKEAKKDIEVRLADVKKTVSTIRQNPEEALRLYAPTKPLRFQNIEMPKISLRDGKPQLLTTHAPPSPELKALKRELKLDIERASNISFGSTTKPTATTSITQHQPPPSSSTNINITKRGGGEVIVSSSLEDDLKKIHDQISNIKRRYKVDIEYDIVRYPPTVKVNIPLQRPAPIRSSGVKIDLGISPLQNIRPNIKDIVNINREGNVTPISLPRFRTDEGQRTQDTPVITPRITTPPDPIDLDITIPRIREVYTPKFTRGQEIKPLVTAKVEPLQIPTTKVDLKLDTQTSFYATYPRPPRLSLPKFDKPRPPFKKKMQTEIYTYRLKLPF